MRRHEIEPVSVLAGLAFLLVAAGYALGQGTDVHVRWLFVVPAALIAIGATILAGVIRHIQRGEPTPQPSEPRV